MRTMTLTLQDCDIHPDEIKKVMKTQTDPSKITSLNILLHLSRLGRLRQRVDNSLSQEDKEKWLKRLHQRQNRCPVTEVTLQTAFDLGLCNGQQLQTLQDSVCVRRSLAKTTSKRTFVLKVYLPDLLVMASSALDLVKLSQL